MATKTTRKKSAVKKAPVATAVTEKIATPPAAPKLKQRLSEQFIGRVLLGAGALGTFASLMLSIEEFHHLKHPAAALNCDINPIVGCGSIIDTWQGHVLLGVPNQFWGLVMFAALATIGAGLLAGARYKLWFWRALQAGLVGGLAFMGWFMFESIVVLKHLCPYCMLTWSAIWPLFWYGTLYNIQEGHCLLTDKISPRVRSFMARHHLDILLAVYLLVAAVILTRFWYYFGQQI